MILKLFFFFSPILIFTVSGKSMEPKIQEGQKVVVLKKRFVPIKKGDIVVAKNPRNERILLKRIKEIRHSGLSRIKKNDTSYFLIGDNGKESTDSRDFGWISKKNIIGKIIFST